MFLSRAETKGSGSYGELSELQVEGLIDSVLGPASGDSKKSGYTYNYSPDDTAGFSLGAVPDSVTGVTKTGTRNFCVATDGVLFSYSIDPEATSNDSPAADGVCDDSGQAVGGTTTTP